MQKPQAASARSQVLSGVIRRDAIEDMAGAVRQFFNLEAVQLEPGACRCQIDFIAAGNTFLYREHYPLRTHLSGELLHNRFGFAIPDQGPSLKFAGEEMDGCRLASAMTGEEMDVFAAGGLRQFVILLDHSRLIALADQAGLPREVQRALLPGRSTMPLVARPQAVAALGCCLRERLRAAAAGDLRMDGADFEDWVYAEVLSMLDVKDAPLGNPPAAVLVRRATELVDAQGGMLRIAHLCSLLRVSPGTLGNAFRSIAGVTPHTFFLRRKLNKARSLLLQADPGEQRVTSVASDLGFTEFGRFSVRYRQMFGETPSQTLQRQTRCRVAVQKDR